MTNIKQEELEEEMPPLTMDTSSPLSTSTGTGTTTKAATATATATATKKKAARKTTENTTVAKQKTTKKKVAKKTTTNAATTPISVAAKTTKKRVAKKTTEASATKKVGAAAKATAATTTKKGGATRKRKSPADPSDDTTNKKRRTRKPRSTKPKEPSEEAQYLHPDLIPAILATAQNPMMQEPEVIVKPFETAASLLNQVEIALFAVQPDLDATRDLLSSRQPPANNGTGTTGTEGDAAGNDNNHASSTLVVNSTTAGHCNTNHIVVLTGDPVRDRLAELRRNLEQRQRQQFPEHKRGLEQRWDKPRIPGSRRRRIEPQPLATATAKISASSTTASSEAAACDPPNDPPPTGFVIFVGQMTCKIRHDNPDRPHFQPLAQTQICKIWKDDMSEQDRQYYMEFAQEARLEYVQQEMEYRATGYYTPSKVFQRLGNNNHNGGTAGGGDGTTTTTTTTTIISNSSGPWVRIDPQEQNGLEREICAYRTVHFPPRPAALNEDYQWRDWRSKVVRKLKDRHILPKDWSTLLIHATNSASAADREYEQTIIGQAVTHAKETLMDAAGWTLDNVDHSAVISAATAEALVKLQEFRNAQTDLVDDVVQPDEVEDLDEEEEGEENDDDDDDDDDEQQGDGDDDDDPIIVEDDPIIVEEV